MTDVLLAGESWEEVTIYTKAKNVTAASSYTEAADHLIAALESTGADVTHQPCHVAHRDFPRTVEAFEEYDLVLLSDIGSQTIQVSPRVAAGETDANRLGALSRYVENGGAVGMIGGYMSFAGEGGKARYAVTPLADVLPVKIARHDDRIETPSGAVPTNGGIDDLPDQWPHVLGYNRFEAEDDAEVLATVNGDPFLVIGDHGEGRAFAYATDCAPHWAPIEFLEWEELPTLWGEIVERVTEG